MSRKYAVYADGQGYVVSASSEQAAVEHLQGVLKAQQQREQFLSDNAEDIRRKAAETRARRAAARAAR